MQNATKEKVEAVEKDQDKPFKWTLNWKISISSIIIVVALLFAGIYYHQATRFNANVTINGTQVGGLTADQALQKLETSILKNEVYIGKDMIFDGNDAKTAFTSEDLSSIKKLLNSQQTFFPLSKAKNYLLMPKKVDQVQMQKCRNQVEQKLLLLNKNLKAAQDAQVRLVNGKITISNSVNGTQYDVAALLQDYQKQEYQSQIHLKPVYIQPNKADSPIVKNELRSMQSLLQRTVNYTVQNKVYSLKASDLIKNAKLTKNGQYQIDPGDLKNGIAKINASQSSLNKNILFKTHSGSVVSVKAQTYGWALNVEKETRQNEQAFENGQNSVVASNVYGNGWNHDAIGFNNITNNGIGSTYAEVSIEQQRIWLYRNGQMVLTTNVVTGRHDVGEDTHPGVWYILYKQSPSILVGSEVGMSHYRVPVAYWAPFTNDGEGFHDASWRGNWSSTAYLDQGSGGCVNTPPSVMKFVYNNLSTYEPVIVY